jgi:antitoxin YefM
LAGCERLEAAATLSFATASAHHPLRIDQIKIVQDTVHMKSITYTAARESLADTMNEVCRDRAPLLITRNRDQSVVMMSLAEYEALEETAHLLRSPANAQRLIDAIRSLEAGQGTEQKLSCEP